MTPSHCLKWIHQAVILCLLSLSCSSFSWAIAPWIINGNAIQQSLGSHTEYLEDAQRTLSIQDVISPTYTYQFTPSRRDRFLLGFTQSNFWLRFSLSNSQPTTQRLFLTLDQANLKEVALYEINQQDAIPITALDKTKSNHVGQPQLALLTDSFELTLAPQQTKTFYLKLHSDHYITQTLTLTSLDRFIYHTNLTYLLMGLCFGLLLALTLYHLYLFIIEHTLIFLYYVLFTSCALGFFIVHYGFLKFFLSTSTLALHSIESLFSYFSLLTNLLLVRSFLNIPARHPRLNFWFNCLIFCLLSLTVAITWMTPSAILKTITLLLLTSTLTWSIAGMTAPAKSTPGIYYYLIAKTGYLILAVLTLLALTGQLPLTLSISHLYLGITLLEAILLAFGLHQITLHRKQYHDHLQQQRIIAEVETRAKTDFATQMNHEIRAPMSGILGMAEILTNSSLSFQQKDFVKTIQASGQHLLKILDDILDFAKIESGTMELEFKPFDLSELIAESLESFQAQAREKKLELISHISDEVPSYVLGDALRLKQILTSLMDHAVRFTNRGEVMLAVDRISEPNHIRFIITDTSTGIPKHYAERLLADFNSEPLRLHARYGYTGLSLTVTKHLIRMMQGEIHAQTRAGKGSRFWFTIPLPKQDSIEETPTPLLRGLEGLKILIADDNASCRSVFEQQVAHWGMKPTTAINGTQALAILRTQANLNEPFDVVLLDQDMPGLSGLELARKIKQDGLLTHTMFIFVLTGTGLLANLQETKDAGIQGILAKPLSGKRLKLALAEALGLLQTIPHQNLAIAEVPIKKSPHILVAEHHPLTAKVIAGMLSHLDTIAHIVDTGEKAFTALGSQTYDLILLDSDMPIMNGIQTAQLIRQRELEMQKPPIPIILLATRIEAQLSKAELQQMNIHEVLIKPIELHKLSFIINQYRGTN